MTAAAEARLKKNLREFNHEMERYSKKILPKEFSDFVKWIAMIGLRKIVRRTPVDLGRLRGNWQVGINSSPEGILDETDKAGNKTIEKGRSIIEGALSIQQIFITNNLPYAIAIENGHSREKAPAGMVSITLTELRSIFP